MLKTLKTYPVYMYHLDVNEPILVASKAEQSEKENLGWTTARMFKEYPKWVGGVLVQSKAQEERLASPQAKSAKVSEAAGNKATPFPPESVKVVKEIQVDGQDTASIKKKKPNPWAKKK